MKFPQRLYVYRLFFLKQIESVHPTFIHHASENLLF